MYNGLQVKHRVYCQILMKLEFSRPIFKKDSYKISWKFFQWKPTCSCGRADGRTDMMKLIDAILSFANAPKINKNTQLRYLSEFLLAVLCTKYISEWKLHGKCTLLRCYPGHKCKHNRKSLLHIKNVNSSMLACMGHGSGFTHVHSTKFGNLWKPKRGTVN
jgi:hypothetical protein